MAKYHCLECGKEFDEPKRYEDDRGEFWGVPCTETMYGCPYCYGDYEEIKDEDEESEEDEDDV